ncbi:hypothetical protein [Corynebacterium kozikiae]|uniref:hypothetical protein n=1 Tax=Corynebacterium kozikiae TaxID=2968469 RepID=UPI00211C61A4|nr:hypothetical protein [Corynebacterium sp. 76QC2CO]MCQ9343735.1 hypothetical protein [Corynebacterium sp. 76QC2CO]
MLYELDLGRTVPSQRDLKSLRPHIDQALPEDPTPSLKEIAQSPNVEHLETPRPAPQEPFLKHPLRVVVKGSDAAASAVLTFLMRADACWVEFAYEPIDPTSPLAVGWGVPGAEFLREAPTKPTPLIRDDAGTAVAGEATIGTWDGTELYGEIIVDSQRLTAGFEEGKKRALGNYGARLVPMLDAPGLLAAPLISGGSPRRKLLRTVPANLVSDQVLAGRALQAGGKELRVVVDGVSRKRPVESATFYRHLRDIQVVRP